LKKEKKREFLKGKGGVNMKMGV